MAGQVGFEPSKDIKVSFEIDKQSRDLRGSLIVRERERLQNETF